MSEILLLGVSHKTAPVALRERLAIAEADVRDVLREAIDAPAVGEAVVLSTCNRTEVYAVVTDAVAAESALLGLLARRAGIRPTELAALIYSPRNCDAARHLFRVACGLESMVLGEAEVQGQVRRAWHTAREEGATAAVTDRLFGAALHAAGRVRSQTAIGEGASSIPSVAVELCRRELGDLATRRVAVVGAGDMAELTARALAAKGVRTDFIANRHAARARSMAERFGGEVVELHDLPTQMVRADIVVTSTASPEPIIGPMELEQVVERRRGDTPLLLVDIAVPRDVDPACRELEGVVVHDIDDLQAVVDRSLGGREEEAVLAGEIVEDEIRRYAHWLGQQDTRPTVAALRRHGADVVERVLAENAGRWETMSERDLARIDAVARAVMQRLLHEPTIHLRESGHGRVALVRELFGLDAEAGLAGDVEAGEAPVDNVRQLHG